MIIYLDGQYQIAIKVLKYYLSFISVLPCCGHAPVDGPLFECLVFGIQLLRLKFHFYYISLASRPSSSYLNVK